MNTNWLSGYTAGIGVMLCSWGGSEIMQGRNFGVLLICLGILIYGLSYLIPADPLYRRRS